LAAAICALLATVVAPSSVFAQRLPQLPQAFLDTTYAPPVGGQVISVNAGDDLQAALNQASAGDIIELQAGATFTGNFILPAKTGSDWIYIRSSAIASLPAPGTRVSPAQASLMPKIVSPNTDAALAADFGAHHYRFVGIEITTTVSDPSTAITNLIVFGYDPNGNQLSSTSYLYDPHGRPNRIMDARNGTTTNWFNAADQISSTKTPVPSTGQSAQVTTNFFDSMGRLIATKLPDNTWITNQFNLTGLITNTYGSRTYPVAYTYDAQGRVKTMKTWQNYVGNTGAATTTWNYDSYRGFLSSKTYDGAASGPSYTYTPAGRLANRLWARGTNTTYSYNNAGDLSAVAYSDGATANISYSYDRRGRQITITQGSATTTRVYDDAGNVLSESYSGGSLSGLSVTNGYDQLRLTAALDELFLDLVALIRHGDGAYHLKSRGFKLAHYGGTRKVFTLALKRRVADGEYGGGVHGQASRAFGSASRLDSSSRRRPSRSSPWVDWVTVCSLLLRLKSISKLPAPQVSTL